MYQNIYDVLIIGGGPAGYTAALYCARANLTTVVLEKLTPGGQMGTTAQVENYPGFAEGVSGAELAQRMQQGAERFGATTLLAEVREVHLAGAPKRIATTEGEYWGHTVILAAGASPKELGVAGERELRGRGVGYCATCDGMFFRNKTVAVVGGGNTAVADALFLSRICESVHLIHRRDTLRATPALAKQLEQVQNIFYHWDCEIIGLEREKKLSGLTLRNKKSGDTTLLPCQGLFVAVGVEPNTALFANQVPLNEAGFIIADETTRTAIPGVFAVGDIRHKPLRQIVTAVSDGAVASMFAEEYLRGHNLI